MYIRSDRNPWAFLAGQSFAFIPVGTKETQETTVRFIKPLSILMLSAMSWASQAQISQDLLTEIETKILGQESRGENVADPEVTALLNSLRHVDIRDLNKYETELKGSSGRIVMAMKEAPGRFVGPIVGGQIVEGNDHIDFDEAGAKGPRGEVNEAKNRFIPSTTEDNIGTRVNAVLGVTLENAIQIRLTDRERKIKPAYRLDLALFIHDRNRDTSNVTNQYYFRRLSVVVDWKYSDGSLRDMVKVVNFDQDIPLANTRFKVLGDLLDRKVILEDENYGLRRVFPIGVGGFIIQTENGMDGSVKLQTDEFPNSTMQSVSVTGDAMPNTRSRVNPSYYRGRPFLALYLNGSRYLAIGMHYQIDSELTRGFVSHGCIRVRDMDLYILDAILNDGVQPNLVAHVVYNLGDYPQYAAYTQLEHPMPKENSYYKARVFSANYTQDVVDCEIVTKKKGDKRRVQYVGGGYHDVIDEDCLSGNVKVKGDAQAVVDYMKHRSADLPPTPINNSLEHTPVTKANQLLYANGGQPWGGQMQPGFQLDNEWSTDTNNYEGQGQTYNQQPQRREPVIKIRAGVTQQMIADAKANVAYYDRILNSSKCRKKTLFDMFGGGSECAQAREYGQAWQNELNSYYYYAN